MERATTAAHTPRRGSYHGSIAMPRFTLASTTLLLAACASAPARPSQQHPFVACFAEALAFVPPGMDRICLSDFLAMERVDHRPQGKLREVQCGRELRSTEPAAADLPAAMGNLWARRQWFEGVTITDYGGTGVPSRARDALGEPSGEVAGHAVCFLSERDVGFGQRAPATWSTIVEDRFVIAANSEELLQSALRRTPPDITTTLLRDVDIADDAALVLAVTKSKAWMVVDRTGTRFEIVTPEVHGPLLELTDLGDGVTVEDLGRRGDCHHWRCHAPRGSSEATTLMLQGMHLFGILILI